MMNQSKFVPNTCNLLTAREKWCIQGAIGFGFPSHRLKKLAQDIKAKHSNYCNCGISLDSHLQTTLYCY